MYDNVNYYGPMKAPFAPTLHETSAVAHRPCRDKPDKDKPDKDKSVPDSRLM